MTGEELTFLMGKVLIVIRHFSSQLSASLPNSSMVRDSPLRVGSIPARAIQASAVSPGRTIEIVTKVKRRKGLLLEMTGEVIRPDGTVAAEADAKMMYEGER